MKNWNETLQQLQEQIVQKRTLENRRNTLKKQKQELEEKEYYLRRQREEEQADVDKLNGRSLAAWFYAVIGQKDKKLDKEQREVYEAAVRHDAVLRELESVNADLKKIDLELRELAGCEARYRETVEQKKQEIRNSGTASGEKLLKLEKQLLECKAMRKELEEAIRAGNQARSAADAALNELDSAEGWGTWDAIGGGGILTDLVKHEHLDQAQWNVENLQVALRRFKTELSDVSIRADMHVGVDEFTRFADFFFDGLFSAWSVLDQIGKSKSKIENVKGQIQQALRRLDGMLGETVQAENRISGELNALVLNED